jgi:YXWGXW repeat-containing protein
MRKLINVITLGFAAAIFVPAVALAQISVSVSIAPPPLPVYVQPPIPGPGYLWTPGYWNWDADANDYYWVPGTWVLAPFIGALWTPGYWSWGGSGYLWHSGYWGTQIGFYGGINYGFGYGGVGYQGGYWDRGAFSYNRTVNNLSNTNITNVYNRTVINNTTVSRVSYNGGNGGVDARPTPAEARFATMPHVSVTPLQLQHEQSAHKNPDQLAARNHGVPTVAATTRPATFSGAGIVRASTVTPQVVRQGPNGPFVPAARTSEAPTPSRMQRAPQYGASPTIDNQSRTQNTAHPPIRSEAGRNAFQAPPTPVAPATQNAQRPNPATRGQYAQRFEPQPHPERMPRPQAAPRLENRGQPAISHENVPRPAPASHASGGADRHHEGGRG